MLFLFFILSIFGYLFAPNSYSHIFCVFQLVFYLFTVFYFLKRTMKSTGVVSFYLFFLLSFLFVNFIYPVFIYPIDPEYFFMFSFGFDENWISKSTALAQLSITAFFLGVSFVKKDATAVNLVFFDKSYFNHAFISFINIVHFLSSFVFIYVTIDNASKNEIMINYHAVFLYIGSLVINTLIKAEIYKTELKNIGFEVFYIYWLELLSVFFIVVFSLWFGDRGPVLQVGLIGLLIYVRYVSVISPKKLFMLIIVGFIVMTFISTTRGSSEMSIKDKGLGVALAEGSKTLLSFDTFWDFGMDFIINNRSLYVAQEIVDERGYLMGLSYFPYLFSPIPGLPLLVTNAVFDKAPDEFSTSKIISEREGVFIWGLGTNAVGDSFMNFGVFGTVFMFMLFGYLVRFLELSNNIYAKIMYMYVFSLALYYPRSSLIIVLEPLRLMLILWLLLQLFNQKKKVL